ncbi:putative aminoadipate reductase [Panaeolus papilionaceus]|nr:putative aminoadipate reductase [Panaeolus papilionaceus]
MSERRTDSGRPLPPLFGDVTLPECVDFHTTHNPNEAMFVFSEDGSSDITKITHLEFGRACDRFAHKIRPGRRGPEGDVVAVVALSDTLLYHAAVVGIIRAGLRPFLISPRNAAEMIAKMMNETSCTRILTTEHTLHDIITDIRNSFSKGLHSETELVVDEMPPLQDIYPFLGHETEDDAHEVYPKATHKPALDNTMIYLHSSGSTGFPKTIPHTYRSFIEWGSFALLDELRKCNDQTVMGCMPLPSFHTMGVMTQLLAPMYCLIISAIYPPTAKTPASLPITPTPDNILDHMRRTKVNGIVMVPTLLHTLSQDKTKLDFLAAMSFVVCGGAPMPPKIGEFLIKSGVRLALIYGGTEFGCPTIPFANPNEPEGWEYIGFDDAASIRWESQGDGAYELQFMTCEHHHLAVENLKNERGYATSDIWVPHPTNPKLWKIVGRKDDVITHASGEKTVPAPMENAIMTSPHIRAAIYFGREKNQPGVLIELEDEIAIDPAKQTQVIQARNLIWPVVEEANRLAPRFSKVFKELILISSPSKPLPRAGKGTVMRKATLTLYHEEIEAIYAEVDSSSNISSIRPPEDWSKENTEKWLIEQLEDMEPGRNFMSNSDMMDQGLDSLGVTILRRRIGAALHACGLAKVAFHISPNDLYQNPSLDKLSTFISNLVASPATSLIAANRVDAVERMIELHSYGLEFPVPASTNDSGKICVLITGTTGSLGAYLLNSFLHNPDIHTIYAYNRPSGKQSISLRHTTRFTDIGFDTAGLRSPKIKFLEGNLAEPRLGLPQGVYDELLENLTVIVHNAWTVNFNLSLSSFESNIVGTRKLIDLARTCKHGSSTRFIFTSSISSAYSWDMTRGPYPEEIVPDAQYSIGIGYGESKYVAECILHRSGIEATTIRIGQISGGQPTGVWATTDWVPILIKSSIALGMLPSMSGVTSWIPMHAVSRGILDVALSPAVTSAYNFVHPRPVEWNILFKYVNNSLVRQGVVNDALSLASYEVWLSQLEMRVSKATTELIDQIPAIKLIDFFRGLKLSLDTAPAMKGVREATGGPMFSTKAAQKISEEIACLTPPSEHDAMLWIGYWQSTGFIETSRAATS